MTVPPAVARIRRDICARNKCDTLDTLNYSDACIACPNKHWTAYLRRACQDNPTTLGDKIERIAQPIAKAIDKIARTKIAKCGGCKKMKERLNAGMPFAEALKLRLKGE